MFVLFRVVEITLANDILKEQAVLFHYQPEGETYNLNVYTQSPVQIHQQVMTNLKIPQSQAQPSTNGTRIQYSSISR